VSVSLSAAYRQCGLIEKISTSGDKYPILLIEVLDVCSWHPKKCDDVWIDFDSSGISSGPCESAYRVVIGLEGTRVVALFHNVKF
jgi:hypothetical protein